VIGGVQDNGTWFTNNLNLTTPWAQPGLGDGSYCAIDNGHNYYYLSRQEGRIAKVQLDGSGNVLGFRRMDPICPRDYLFINPFVLDPNNNDVMYLAEGPRIWRNDSLSAIPLTGAWDTISTGWFQLPDTIPQAATVVTALAVAKSNSSKLYIGTSKRKVYRIDNANTFSPVMTDIMSSLFPGNAYVSCIAVDPVNENNVLVAFSNYSVYSIFYSTDGGATFTKSAGNLELNQAGTGAAPSIRWLSILPTPNGHVYLAATSVGIYGTNALNGLNTVWTNLSPNEIGYMVVDMIDAREGDGYVVAGTHGAGLYSTSITDTLMTGLQFQPETSLLKLSPNPARQYCRIQTTLPEDSYLTVFDAAGKVILRRKLRTDLDIRTTEWRAGLYFVHLTSGERTVVEKLIVER
jgi:hypothetical protein